MKIATDQRRQLSAFLRARREALSPLEAGVPLSPNTRRRTPGLRREEVAQLSGISSTWYAWLEQGREISLSTGALARLADTLQMTDAERAYLFELSQRRDPSPPAPISPATVPDDLMRVLEAIGAPAYLLDPLWHARAWNEAAADLFAPWFDSGETSILRFVFLNPAARSFILDWEDRAQRLLAEFRADSARSPEEASVHQLVSDLRRESPDFVRLWNSHAVLGRGGGARLFNHPRHGELRYLQTTMIPAAQGDFKIVILLPEKAMHVPIRQESTTTRGASDARLRARS